MTDDPSRIFALMDEIGRDAALGRACVANGLAGWDAQGKMWFQPPEDVIAEAAVAAFLATRPARPDREAVTEAIGYHFAALVSGNRMPHMSGDPRNRLLPHVRRVFDDCCNEAASAVLALLPPPAAVGDE